ARAGVVCGEGAGVGAAIARGGGAADAAGSSSTCGVGVFRGLGVSSFCADFDFALFFAFSDVSFAPDFFFAVFGFGVGVWCCFAFGVGDFFGFGVDAARVSVSSDSSRRFFSLTCARRRPATNAPNASAVASQMRKRNTATERNRARDAINACSIDLLKKLKIQRAAPFRRCDRLTSLLGDQASGAAGAGARASATRIFPRSRRMMAFNLPPSNNSRHVRYIQVSSTMIDASAR